VSNVLTWWVEIPKNFSLGMQEENPLLGIGGGLLKGSGLALTRLAIGTYEALSFPIPFPKGYASPYEGLELQDYAWE
jgi:putative exosortase-associated protein (TIGR04073 family)